MSDRRTEIDDTPPADYLSTEPSDDDRLLARQTDLLGGAVQWWMFCKVAIRLHGIVLWVARADGLASRTRRWLVAGITIAAANLAGVGIYTVHRIEETAVADERAAVLARKVVDDRIELLRLVSDSNAALQKQVDEMKLDIRELRRALQRLSGRDPLHGKVDTDPGPDSSRLGSSGPDKLSWLLELEPSQL